MVVPFASRATKRIARKAPSRKGCAKIERSLCRAPWHRRPGYDLRRASRYHLDFLSNTAHERLVQGFPSDASFFRASCSSLSMLLRSFLGNPNIKIHLFPLLVATSVRNPPRFPSPGRAIRFFRSPATQVRVEKATGHLPYSFAKAIRCQSLLSCPTVKPPGLIDRHHTLF